MSDYTLGVAEHVSTYTAARAPYLEAMLHTRQLSVGVAPLYHLVEYAHSLEIPDFVFLNPAVQALERLGAEFVILWVSRIRVHVDRRSPHLTCHTNLADQMTYCLIERRRCDRCSLLRCTHTSVSNSSQAEDCPFNMVAACRMAGQSAQEAFDTLATLLAQRHRDWDMMIDCLPSWDPQTDSQVRQYVEGIQNLVQANISWR
jgi:terpene synthase-like protein